MTSDIEAIQNEKMGMGHSQRRWYYPSLTPHIFAKILSIHLRFFVKVWQEPVDHANMSLSVVALVKKCINSKD